MPTKFEAADILAAWAEDSTIREAAALKFAIHCVMVKLNLTQLVITPEDVVATAKDTRAFQTDQRLGGIMRYQRFDVSTTAASPGLVNTGDLKDPTVDEEIISEPVDTNISTP